LKIANKLQKACQTNYEKLVKRNCEKPATRTVTRKKYFLQVQIALKAADHTIYRKLDMFKIQRKFTQEK